MESQDLDGVTADLKKLNLWDESFLGEHFARTCSEPAEPPKEGTSQVVHIRSKIIDYQKLYRDKGVTARCAVQASLEDPSVISVRTYVEHMNAHNCTSGSWSAVWTVKILEEKEAELSGEVKLHTYYAEGTCNVHSRATRTFESVKVSTEEEKVHAMVAVFEKETMSYEEQLSKVVVDKIVAWEKGLYSDVTNMYGDLDGQLRKLRRILPITKTRFKWDSAAQRQVQLLKS
jgi:hypothetical protein